MSKQEFKKLIEDQRKLKKSDKFEGTFLDYLGLIESGDAKVKLAHKRLFDSISSHGINVLDETDPRCRKLFNGEKTRVYNYFKDEFFGMEPSLAKIMRYLVVCSLMEVTCNK